MTIEALKANLSHQRRLLEEMLVLNEELKNASSKEETNFFETAIQSVVSQTSIINNSLPKILEDITIQKAKAGITGKKTAMQPIQTFSGLVVLNKEDKEKFMKELRIEEDIMKKMKGIGKGKKSEGKDNSYKKPNYYITLSSKLFSNIAYKLANNPDISKSLNLNLKKANMYYLPGTYLSITLFSMLIAFVFYIIIALIYSFFNMSMTASLYPTLKFSGMDGLALRLLKNIGLAILVPLGVFVIALTYPQTQATSVSNIIENELPFVIMHMSSVAGRGVEPKKVFEILSKSPEYPSISNEIKKVMNQINLYGYDLVTALKNIAKSTSNEKLAGLLNGIATNIVFGGDLKAYLDKRSSDSLLDYKLARKKYSAMAETSMDIYIGILVAAPLILMVLLILMNVTGFGFGLSMSTLTMILIGGIALLNIGFLMFLQIKQPS